MEEDEDEDDEDDEGEEVKNVDKYEEEELAPMGGIADCEGALMRAMLSLSLAAKAEGAADACSERDAAGAELDAMASTGGGGISGQGARYATTTATPNIVCT